MLAFHKVLNVFVALAAKIFTSPDSIAWHSLQPTCQDGNGYPRHGSSPAKCLTAEHSVIFGFLEQMGAPLGINY
jgi:hypothetical protein